MVNSTRYRWQAQPIPLSMLILSVLTLFTILIFNAPYTGFYFNPSTGEIFGVSESNHSTLQIGDVLIKVGEVSFEDYDTDSNQPLFTTEMKKGDLIPITVQRNGTQQTVLWQMPGFHVDEFRGRLFNIWWLAYIFWIFGACIEAFIRPREIRWWLLFLSIHLSGLWIMLGSVSSWHLWYGSVLFHAITWLLLPVYLHLNWIFPKPLFAFPKQATLLLYIVSAFFFIAELIQAMPQNLYGLAFVFALVGSITLQIAHFIWKPEQRKQLKLLLTAVLFSSIPLIALGITSVFGKLPSNSPVVLLFLLFIPVVYIYLILRNQLGGLEVRANLFISILAFLIIIGTILIILIQLVALLPIELSAPLNFIIPLLTAVLSIQLFPSFRKYIEKTILSITIDYEKLQESYANLIITNTTMENLLRMLENDIFPSLLIRQYALVQVENHHLSPLLMKQVTQAQLPEKEAISKLHDIAGKFIPNLPPNDDWLRLVLPLKLGNETLGFFLLGSRDPDDIYHQQEIPSLQSIANQTAIALSNIAHAETLRAMYKSGLERYEQERLRLGRDLHDTVLNDLSGLSKNLNKDSQQDYEEVTYRLREIVNDLRPPMLMYGLKAAISGLAEDLMQKADDKVKVIVDIEATDERLPENIEIHLFRIVQEACKNSLRHANASLIKIYGSLSAHQAELAIEDDGIGFDLYGKWNLDTILAKRHFGLVGIAERAHVIGAKLKIEPKPHTKIQVLWEDEKKAFI
ncbi:MAG: hypothetical protein JNM46_06695 [Anaerolineales bacterium]|nr:hypothetical protein [Anaerolineales bacterium]